VQWIEWSRHPQSTNQNPPTARSALPAAALGGSKAPNKRGGNGERRIGGGRGSLALAGVETKADLFLVAVALEFGKFFLGAMLTDVWTWDSFGPTLQSLFAGPLKTGCESGSNFQPNAHKAMLLVLAATLSYQQSKILSSKVDFFSWIF
jgi:hypothetical protein